MSALSHAPEIEDLLERASTAVDIAKGDAMKNDYEATLDGVEEALALLGRLQGLLEEKVDA
jgi:hypothetical protein